VFTTLIWRALVADNNSRGWLYAVLGGLTLCALVFCYFYLWTAAMAWLTGCGLLWFYFRRDARARTVQVLVIVMVMALFALGPYVNLLSQRSTSLDQSQLLIYTHRLDLLRLPEILGALVLIVLVVAGRRGKQKLSSVTNIFTASFALLPFILFNQQVVTGRSLQPFHFENFIANYAVLVGVVLLIGTVTRRSPSFWRLVFVVCFVWGALEVVLPARARYATNVANDEVIPAMKRLKELSATDGTLSGLRSAGKTPAVVFSPHTDVMRVVPTWTSQGILLGVGSLDFGGSRSELKVYSYLYYSGVNGEALRELLNDRSADTFMNYYARSAIFGLPRVSSNLTFNFKPIQNAEIEDQVRNYETYVASFSREAALKHPLGYLVVRRDAAFDFSRIDRWYKREEAEHYGPYDLYRLSPLN
jgi:hypothetical protein